MYVRDESLNCVSTNECYVAPEANLSPRTHRAHMETRDGGGQRLQSYTNEYRLHPPPEIMTQSTKRSGFARAKLDNLSSALSLRVARRSRRYPTIALARLATAATPVHATPVAAAAPANIALNVHAANPEPWFRARPAVRARPDLYLPVLHVPNPNRTCSCRIICMPLGRRQPRTAYI